MKKKANRKKLNNNLQKEVWEKLKESIPDNCNGCKWCLPHLTQEDILELNWKQNYNKPIT